MTDLTILDESNVRLQRGPPELIADEMDGSSDAQMARAGGSMHPLNDSLVKCGWYISSILKTVWWRWL